MISAANLSYPSTEKAVSKTYGIKYRKNINLTSNCDHDRTPVKYLNVLHHNRTQKYFF